MYEELAEKRILFLKGEINYRSATNLAAQILYLDALSSEEITLYINSLGGDITQGFFTIYNAMQSVDSPIKTICLGEASSCAAAIVASGDHGKRFAFAQSSLMLHPVWTPEISGSEKQVKEDLKRLKDLDQIFFDLLSLHTGQKSSKIRRDCQKDRYFSPTEAVKYGLIDQIITPRKTANQNKSG